MMGVLIRSGAPKENVPFGTNSEWDQFDYLVALVGNLDGTNGRIFTFRDHCCAIGFGYL